MKRASVILAAFLLTAATCVDRAQELCKAEPRLCEIQPPVPSPSPSEVPSPAPSPTAQPTPVPPSPSPSPDASPSPLPSPSPVVTPTPCPVLTTSQTETNVPFSSVALPTQFSGLAPSVWMASSWQARLGLGGAPPPQYLKNAIFTPLAHQGVEGHHPAGGSPSRDARHVTRLVVGLLAIRGEHSLSTHEAPGFINRVQVSHMNNDDRGRSAEREASLSLQEPSHPVQIGRADHDHILPILAALVGPIGTENCTPCAEHIRRQTEPHTEGSDHNVRNYVPDGDGWVRSTNCPGKGCSYVNTKPWLGFPACSSFAKREGARPKENPPDNVCRPAAPAPTPTPCVPPSPGPTGPSDVDRINIFHYDNADQGCKIKNNPFVIPQDPPCKNREIHATLTPKAVPPCAVSNCDAQLHGDNVTWWAGGQLIGAEPVDVGCAIVGRHDSNPIFNVFMRATGGRCPNGFSLKVRLVAPDGKVFEVEKTVLPQ